MTNGACATNAHTIGGMSACEPVTDAPVTDAPVIDAPVIDAPVIDAPVIELRFAHVHCDTDGVI